MIKFEYSSDELKELCEYTLKTCLEKKGITNALVSISDNNSLSIDVRTQNIETLEQSQEQSISITVYKEQQVGYSSSSDFSISSINSIIDAAYHIATYTSVDKCAGLPNAQDLATNEDMRECELYHPWDIDASQAIKIATEMEDAVYANDSIINSDGCGLSTNNGQFVMANTLGFMQGYAYSNHSIWANAIAGYKDDVDSMQSESWYSQKRCSKSLENYLSISKIAAERAKAKLNPQKISTRSCPVIFESTIASKLFGGLLAAISGNNQYQKNSFLLDSIGQQILPNYLSIYENPFLLKGMSSACFDSDGVRTKQTHIVKDGIIQTFILSTYSSRKLNMPVTGHAGGCHNLELQYNTEPKYSEHICPDLNALMQKMGTGLLVTDTMGQGLNIVTGDYSKGASGFWVENGIILYPVNEITIAGNLKSMLQNIVAIANDIYEGGSILTGSILIDNMMIAGS
jgi:PmbA protein